MTKQTKKAIQTKQALTDAFWELYCENKIEKITVKAITDKAGYNRSTFYEYFCDVYEVLEDIERNLLLKHRQIMIQNLQITEPETAKANILEFLSYNVPYIAVLLGPDGDHNFYNKAKDHIATFLQEYMDADKNDIHVQMNIELFSGAVISLINFWYHHQEELTLQEAFTAMLQFMKNGATPFFENLNLVLLK